MRTEPFADTDLTRDAFLGGLAHLYQPQDGYRAGLDPVLLAACIPARAGQSVLDLGCGAGAALICLGARVTGLDLAGVELQPAYATLARRNLAENGLSGSIETADLISLPAALRARSFDHVMANPPYFDADTGVRATDPGRSVARAGATPLQDWVDTATRRVRPGGTVTFIQKANRLPALMSCMTQSLGALELWPMCPRPGQAPHLILLRGRKDRRSPFRLHPALPLHQDPCAPNAGSDYSSVVIAVTRRAQPLPFPT